LKPQKRINRPRFYYGNGWGVDRALRTQHTFGSAYSDTAAVTSCNRQSREVVNCNKLNKIISVSNFSRQKVEQIRANVFYSTF